jgi:hypothetical protein
MHEQIIWRTDQNFVICFRDIPDLGGECVVIYNELYILMEFKTGHLCFLCTDLIEV